MDSTTSCTEVGRLPRTNLLHYYSLGKDFIFGKWNSLWWSRNVSRQYLCFLKVNNSAVPVSTVAIYSDGSASSRGESQRNYRYPVVSTIVFTFDF